MKKMKLSKKRKDNNWNGFDYIVIIGAILLVITGVTLLVIL